MQGIRILAPFGDAAAYGAARATLRILKCLEDRGAKIHVVTRPNADPALRELIDGLHATTSMAPWGPIMGKNLLNPMRLFDAFKGMLATSASVHRAIRSFKPTHLYFGSFLFFFYSSLAVAGRKIPVVYRVGECLPNRFWSGMVAGTLAGKAARIVCISKFIKGHAEECGFSADKLSVIYCLPPPVPAHRAGKNTFRNDGGDAVVSFIGQVRRFKGIHHFVEMAIELLREQNNAVFYMAGDYSYNNPLAASLMARVRALGLDKKIVFLGFLDSVEALLRETDVLCVPSDTREALGNVVLEAKAAGVPSVVFPDGGLPEMIEHGVDGYVCREKTTAALKEGALFFIGNRARLMSAKEKAKQSLRKFDYQTIADQWARVFMETVQK